MILLEILLDGAALLVLLWALVLFAEVFCAVASGAETKSAEGMRKQVAVLVPAYDEEFTLPETLRNIASQLRKTDRLLVIADNCSDNTAGVAKTAGAEVIERNDMARRGKGYALDFGVRYLENAAPDIVLIVDADCQLAPGAVDKLARVCAASNRPTQALYLMRAPDGAGLSGRIAEFAWIVKNQVRPTGLLQMGLPCQLMGTGMAFPWSCIVTANLASGEIVEDMQLGIALTREGKPPLFCPEALVTSEFPTSREGLETQRTRWEHGHLGVITGSVLPLLGESLMRGSLAQTALALDLAVPPLALLTLAVCAVWVVSALLYGVAGELLAFEIATSAAILCALAVLMSWVRNGRGIISLGNLTLAVFYPLRKLPLYVRFLVARQTTWIRSKRDGDQS